MSTPVLARGAAEVSEAAKSFEAELRRHADHPRLTKLIDACVSEGLVADFARYDESAKTRQKEHRGLVRRALWGGGLGALLSIARLTREAEWISYVEGACFAVATYAVAQGLHRSRRDAWLLSRYEAERRRLKIFELAARPAIWAEKEPADWGTEVRAGMDRLGTLREDNIEDLASSEPPPAIPPPGPYPFADRPVLSALVRFYRRAHLDGQIEYFRKVGGSQGHGFLKGEAFSYLMFGLIVALVALHIWLELAHHRDASMVFLGASAAAAGLWAVLRTWRSANEFKRNATRANAKLHVLEKHRESLDKELTEPVPDAWKIFATLALCDAVLHADQREWLGLMHEAEWF